MAGDGPGEFFPQCSKKRVARAAAALPTNHGRASEPFLPLPLGCWHGELGDPCLLYLGWLQQPVLKRDEHSTKEPDFVSALWDSFRGITGAFQPVTTWRGKYKAALLGIGFPPSSLSSAAAEAGEG